MTGIFGDDKLYTANRPAPLAFGQVGASLGQRRHSALTARSMQHTSLVQRAGKWLVVVSLLAFGFAMAQPEPSLNQVYATAQAGKLDEAQTMIQQVLISHPNSSKAHFVRAELFARQGNLKLAREALATAEKLSPGLAFAKPDAVQALRAQLAAKSTPKSVNSAPGSYAAPANTASSSSWTLPLLLAGGVMVAGYFIFRRRNPQPLPQQPIYSGQGGGQGGLGGPQTFGMGNGAAAMQPGYPQQAGYPQQGGSGIGGRIMGGVATGLAVGAGVMAAEAIGRNLMGNHHSAPAPGPVDNFSNNNDDQALERNTDMGGQNFGINDTSSWDDGGGSDAGGGGDWDSN